MTCLHHVHADIRAKFKAAGCDTSGDRAALASAILGRKVQPFGPAAIQAHEIPQLLASLDAALNEPFEETHDRPAHA